MRSLRVVGIAEDGAVVLEDSARRERYTVPADEQLRAAARGDLTRLGQIAIELESQLRPREIQARIRAGASVDQVAAAAGVPTQKIERFAYPVLLERARTAELARNAHPVRDDGPDLRTLDETVTHTFGLRGQDPTTVDWDSWKGEDAKWVVGLCWRSGKSDIRAHWTFQPGAHGGTVTALDDHARDLVEGRPQQPLRPVGPVIDMARTEPPEAPVPTAAESVPAAVNGSAPIAPEQRRVTPASRTATRTRPDTRPEPRPTAQAEAQAEVRTPTRTEVRAEQPPTHPAARNSDTRSTTETLKPTAQDPAVTEPTSVSVGSAVEEPAASPTPSSKAPSSPTPASQTPVGSRTPAVPETPVVEAPAVDTDAVESGAVEAGAAEELAAEVPAEEAPAEKTPAAAAPAPEAAVAEQPDPSEVRKQPPARPRAKKGKPVMPSWDEVLLGVRGK